MCAKPFQLLTNCATYLGNRAVSADRTFTQPDETQSTWAGVSKVVLGGANILYTRLRCDLQRLSPTDNREPERELNSADWGPRWSLLEEIITAEDKHALTANKFEPVTHDLQKYVTARTGKNSTRSVLVCEMCVCL